MTVTNSQTGTNVVEIANGLFRINTPVQIAPGQHFSFNQYLIVDEEPLLFHTGPRKLFPLVSEAVATILPIDRLRYVAFSHVEADECGSLNDWLRHAPAAEPVCGNIAAMVSIADLADRTPRAMADGETLVLGQHTLRWLDAPHLPHGWDCGYLIDESTQTLLCGDLFTQGGAKLPAITETDILGPSEAFRAPMDYFAHSTHTRCLLEKLAATNPQILACMHGSAWQGNGAEMLLDLADVVCRERP